jgi:predicted deacylase
MTIGLQGIKNVLRELGMIGGSIRRPPYQVFIRKTTWLRAAVGGILKFHVSPGDFVDEGQSIATNYGILGAEQHILKSTVSGIVLSMATMPAVKPGEPICHIALVSPRQLARFQKRLSKSKNDPHNQVQVDLATSLDLVKP